VQCNTSETTTIPNLKYEGWEATIELGSTERTAHKYTCINYLHISPDDNGFVNRENKITCTEKTVRIIIKT
jgi:hypothetical protein